MPDQLQSIERNLQEISRLARQTLSLLAATDRTEEPSKYLAVVLNTRALREMWAWHARMEFELIPDMLSCDLHVAEHLKQICEENKVIDGYLASIGGTPWPRSPQAGLYAIGTRATQILNELLSQVERERNTILPLLRRWMTAATIDTVVL
jgi:hypothetical protein